ncbi:MAG TPA: tetratricopeptide repeat protein [Bryobacteraceae bacterium]
MAQLYHSDSIRVQLEKILRTPPLDVSPSLSRFLRYVVEESLAGRGSTLKESVLGQNVFDRGAEFNPRADPIVRVQARNLRSRLAQYYAGPGVNDPVIIDIPKGTYSPVFHWVSPPDPEPAAEPEPEASLASPASEPQSAPRPLKREIARAVLPAIAIAAAALWIMGPRPRAPSPVSAASVRAHDPDPAAQDLYIRGRFRMDRQTEAGLRDSAASFERAVARDPHFAAAYAGEADAYNLLAQLGYIPPGEGMERARRAAQQALAEDPNLAEGHVALAAVIEAYDWNWSGAEREYRRALSLNPALPAAHLWYGAFLRDQGRLDEALRELRRSAELDPLSVLTSVNLAHALLIKGDYAAAASQAHHVSELAPELTSADIILSYVYRAQSRTADARAALAHARQAASENPHGLAVVACAYARQGQREESARLLQELERMSKERYVSPFDMGSVALTLGQEDRALPLLEEALRQRSSGLIFLRQDACLRHGKLHSLIDRMHFQG